jgi:hypothetical protein
MPNRFSPTAATFSGCDSRARRSRRKPVISCVTPFVALAVALAGTVDHRRFARDDCGLVNESVRRFRLPAFSAHVKHIFRGAAIGAAALVDTGCRRLKGAPSWPTTTRIGLAFFAYAIYEASLSSPFSSWRKRNFFACDCHTIGLVNLAWLAGLVALNELLLTRANDGSARSRDL